MKKEEYKKFPEYDFSIKAIEKLKKNPWPKYEFSENPLEFSSKITSSILKEFEIFPNLLRLLKPNQFKFKVFRAREVNSFTNIDLFTEHTYPPINLTKFGRCNFPSHPVFYGSNNPLTALIEAAGYEDYKDKFFCISRWSIKESDKDLILENYLHTKLDKINGFEVLANTEIDNFNKSIDNSLTESQKKGLKEYLKFLSDSFINDDNYTVSASLAHRTIYAPHKFKTDILVYPSKQTQMRSVNFAVNPNFVDNEMMIEKFYFVKLNSYNPENAEFNLTFTKHGTIMNNMILWKDLHPEDTEYKEEFMKDFKDVLPEKYKFNIEKNVT